MEHGEESLRDVLACERDAQDGPGKLAARRDALIFEHLKRARPLELQTHLTESRLAKILRKQRVKGVQ